MRTKAEPEQALLIPSAKVCPRCAATKHEKEFSRLNTPSGERLRTYCKLCECERSKEFRTRYPASVRSSVYAWRTRNREHLRTYGRQYYKDNPEKIRRSNLRKYDLSLEKFNHIFRGQRSCCGICGSSHHNGKNWHVDHDHESGVVRGILCHGCNTGLGGFRDSVGFLNSAIEYLVRGGSNSTLITHKLLSSLGDGTPGEARALTSRSYWREEEY